MVLSKRGSKEGVRPIFRMKILTSVVNNPDFIEIQHLTFKKFINCPYEFIVFNDAKAYNDITNGGDLTLWKKIEERCEKLGIQCIRVENDHIRSTEMSVRHEHAFNNYIVKYQRENPDEYLLIDSDMFLIDHLEIEEYRKYKTALVVQGRTIGGVAMNYAWPGLFYVDIRKYGAETNALINWGIKAGGDTGSMMYYWLLAQTSAERIPDGGLIRRTAEPQHRDDIYYIRHLWSLSWDETELPENLRAKKKLVQFIKSDPRNKGGKYFCEIYDGKFLHYRAGTNWLKEGMKMHVMLSSVLKHIISGMVA
jgi:hypothetical protein